MSGHLCHLHGEDYPETLRLLAALLNGRGEEKGYCPSRNGAWVNWETLTTETKLSSTELALVHIARGCAMLERAGRTPPLLRSVVTDVVGAVC